MSAAPDKAKLSEQAGERVDERAYLAASRWLAAKGRYPEAREVLLNLLKADSNCLEALVQLGALAEADGYVQAAWSAFSRAVEIAPANPVALTGLGHILSGRDDPAGAKAKYLAALAAAPDFAPAHQGLACCLIALGEAGAEAHFRAGFSGNAVVHARASEAKGRIPMLLLASGRGGNVPCKGLIDPEIFSVTTLYADFFDETAELPPHEILLNAIGDADICGAALRQAALIVRASTKPAINHPDCVSATTREENARRLRNIPGIVTPRIELLPRAGLRAERLQFPLLLRSPGFHAGQNFIRVEAAAELDAALASLPGEQILGIEYLDATGPDGRSRKYRAMFIDGQIYPLHLAAGADWKVHYFTSSMASDAELRAEERQFLEDMPGVLGPRAMAALEAVRDALGLDYAGVDFALAKDGALILFEANATMIIHRPDARDIWDYRRPAIDAAIGAAKAMLWRRVAG